MIFNIIPQLVHHFIGKPFNPLINSGALLSSALLLQLVKPELDDLARKYEYVLEIFEVSNCFPISCLITAKDHFSYHSFIWSFIGSFLENGRWRSCAIQQLYIFSRKRICRQRLCPYLFLERKPMLSSRCRHQTDSWTLFSGTFPR